MPDITHPLNLSARRFAAATQRFTRIRPPAALLADSGPESQRTVVRHLPGVGWIIGMASCLVFALVSLAVRGNAWGPAVAAVGCTLASILLTGALHEGALFRTSERLGAGMGSLALVVVLAAKFVLLAAVASASEAGVIAALFAGHVVSRFAPLTMAHWLGSGEQVDPVTVRVGGLWCLVPLVLMVPAAGVAFLLLALLVCGLAGLALLRSCRRRQLAYGDDVLGAAQQVCEVAFYLGAAIAA